MSSARDNTTSPQSDNVEDIGEINNSQMIEAVVKKIVQQEDYSVYLLNDAKYILQDKPLNFFMDDDNNINERVEKFLFLTT